MQFYYGNYQHTPNSVAFAGINRSFTRGQTARKHILHVAWGLKGKLLSTSQSDTFSQLSTLINAYSQDGLSAGLLDNNGNQTPFTIVNAQSIGGTRVTSPVSHESIAGADGVTYLRYTIGLEADFLVAAPNDLLSFQESVSFTDNMGLPVYVERLPQNGLPVLQQVSQTSWYYATQTGHLETPGAFPTPIKPIFSLTTLRTSGNNAQAIKYDSPKTIRGVPVSYGVNWTYNFISVQPLFGFPNTFG